MRWPVPAGALAAGCGLAVLVAQGGVVPLPTRHSNPTASGPVAHLQVVPASADAPPRTVLRPADVTQQLLVAVQLAPAASKAGVRVPSRVTHVVAASHHTVLLALGTHPAVSDLKVSTSSPLSGATTLSDPGTTTTGTTPTDTTTTTGTTTTGTTTTGTTATDTGTTTTGTTTTDPGTTTTGTTTTDPGTTTTGTTTTDPGTTTTGTTPTDTTTTTTTTDTTTTTTPTAPPSPPAV